MASSKKSKKDLENIFIESINKVSKILKKNPSDITRDEYVLCSRFINSKDRLHKDNLESIGGYKQALSALFPHTDCEDPKKADSSEYDTIISSFVKYVKENKHLPTIKDLREILTPKNISVKKHFQTIQDLLEKASEQYPEIKDSIFNDSSFTEDYYKNVLETIKKYNKFIVTTAVSNKRVHEDLFSCLKSYAEINDALILVLPCEDVANRRQESEWVLDPKLKEVLVVYKDTHLNNNIFLSDIKVSAKMLLPTTGLARLAQSEGSMILASPKQFLEYIPISNEKLPLALMTTGAVTVDDYQSNDFYMSKRLSKIAENDHVLGCLVVEIEDEEIFHFRQIQFNEGKIIDLDKEYYPDGTVNFVSGAICVFGDSHVTVRDEEVHEAAKEIVEYIGVNDVVLHDIADNECCSHHIANKPVLRAINYVKNVGTIEKECRAVAEYLKEVSSWIKGKIIVVRSNHDAFLDRYIEEGRYAKDHVNLYFMLDVVKAYMEGNNPLQYIIENKLETPESTLVRWLDYNEDCKIFGHQISNHGHLGSGGSKGSVQNIEKCYKTSVIGHSHTPRIHRGVYQVGTFSRRDLSYLKGPNSWVSTCCIMYPNGSRTLINIIKSPEGNYSWKI